jgi:hypothetical protein
VVLGLKELVYGAKELVYGTKEMVLKELVLVVVVEQM